MQEQDKQHIVVLTGSGISADSGLQTFRDSGGLWEGYDINDVATPEAWKKDPETVLAFYNDRRKQAWNAEPNAAHKALADLEKQYQVTIITQNVDNLHENAGSTNVIHLHGELAKVRSENDPSLTEDIGGKKIELGDTAEDGRQLRPHVVWFGEPVPMMETAIEITTKADIFAVIGTSLSVYPAASLLQYVPGDADKYLVDPSIPSSHLIDKQWHTIAQKAKNGVPQMARQLVHSNSR